MATPLYTRSLSAVDEAMTGNDELNQYAIPYGRTDLRQAIAGYYRRFYDFEVDAEEELTVCLGATEAMACTLRALCKPGDSVVLGEGSIRLGILILIFEPFHEIYPNQAAVFYLNTKYCRLYEGDDDEWHVDWDMLESRLQEGDVKCIVLNTPHNPTGKVFTKAEMTRIADLAVKYNAYVVTDEIYEHMIFEGEPHHIIASLPGMRDRSFIISAISKSASATGWRVGWVISPRKYTEIIRAVHDQMVLQSPSPMQFGTIAFTQLGDDYFKHYLPGKYQRRRDLLVPALRDLGFKVTTPHAAYYAFANFRGVPQLKDMSSWEASDYLVEHGVAGVAGANFCEKGSGRGDDCIRFCFCRTDDELKEAIARLRKALQRSFTFEYITITIHNMSNPPGGTASPPSWATAGGGENATRPRLSGWMVTGDQPSGHSQASTTVAGQRETGGPMDDFLPKLRQFLSIVDPDREKASSDEDLLRVLREYDTPNELFASLDKQKNPQHIRDFDHTHSPLPDGGPPTSSPDKKKRKRDEDSPDDSKEDDLSFIVPDDDDVTDTSDWSGGPTLPDGQKHGVFHIVDDPDYTASSSSSDPSPATSPNVSASPAPQRPVCMYGTKCYRKNPVHFKEFAHPWLDKNDNDDDATNVSTYHQLAVL
ncbi:hypothetical protein FOZ60_009667 [Perkinsus olseni]|uniref:Aminotransferase class I/classII domain-containing protein n=1 Tax=Perkinsus olseni TaxID=32597 RepID=A0A7J6PEM7_PEROL|nr:hypothetical protein FOZ60_009667 [Perkinsus olseni]